jgi:hypothetical protein
MHAPAPWPSPRARRGRASTLSPSRLLRLVAPCWPPARPSPLCSAPCPSSRGPNTKGRTTSSSLHPHADAMPPQPVWQPVPAHAACSPTPSHSTPRGSFLPPGKDLTPPAPSPHGTRHSYAPVPAPLLPHAHPHPSARTAPAPRRRPAPLASAAHAPPRPKPPRARRAFWLATLHSRCTNSRRWLCPACRRAVRGPRAATERAPRGLRAGHA